MGHMISKDALARGLQYVRRNGSELMGALAAHATGLASGDDVLVHLLLYQNDDGGWKRFDDDMEGALSTISQTWLGLQWLSWTCPFDSSPSIALWISFAGHSTLATTGTNHRGSLNLTSHLGWFPAIMRTSCG